METEQEPGALRGIRVIEFGQYIAGPLLGMLLADQGADVVKVEPPTGDPARREPAFAVWNRGKRSVVVDLKGQEGRLRAQELITTADVVIENFRPGVADRLGIGYAAMVDRTPTLIYCSLPGFGPESPYRQTKAWDPMICALTGAFWRDEETGWAVPSPASDQPLFTSIPIASNLAAIAGAVAVAMALIARQRTGRGQRIEVPLYNAMFVAIGIWLTRAHTALPRPAVANLAHSGALMRQYKCADDRYVQIQRSSLSSPEHSLHRLFAALGHPEWTEEALEESQGGVSPQTTRKWLGRMADRLREKASEEWEDLLNALGVPCTVIRTSEEWLKHEHALASGMVVELDDPVYGRMKQPGIPIRLAATPGRIARPAPTLGEHTAEVSSETLQKGTNPNVAPAPTPMADVTSVLQSVRVLDLSIILAGPTCGRVLADYGADVIKIDEFPYARQPDPNYVELYLELNEGKRSIILDLKSQHGRDVLRRLVETSDVVLENFRKGKLELLGLGYEDVRRWKPDIVYASMDCFGYDGPWSQRPGWEHNAQACGLQVGYGRLGDRPLIASLPINDMGTGMLCAYAVALALHERQRTGRGQRVTAGLAFTAGIMQSQYLLDYAGIERREREHPSGLGPSALFRLYRAADGWVFFSCVDAEDWQRLISQQPFAALASDPRFATEHARRASDDELTSVLGSIFSQAPRDRWVQLLNRHGLSTVNALCFDDLRSDPAIRRAGLLVTREHPGFGLVDHVGTIVHLSETPSRPGRPASIRGSDARDILTQIGYSEDEIRLMEVEGVVRA